MVVEHASPEAKKRMCARGDCARPHVLGDRFCFDHLDLSELEAAVNEPDDEEREEEVREVAKSDRISTDGPTCPSCGKQYGAGTNGPAYLAKHVATCKGPVATSGRIAAATAHKVSTPGTKQATRSRPHRADPPRARKSGKRSSVPRDHKAERERRKARTSAGTKRAPRSRKGRQNGAIATPPPDTAPVISPAAFIAALEAERAKIDDAIVAVRRLA